MNLKITVVIPVGPKQAHKKWLKECIASVSKQTLMPDEVLLIDDMANLKENFPGALILDNENISFRVWKSPWLLGVAHAFNFGVALARNDWVFMLGADDELTSDCLEKCTAAVQRHNELMGYYYVGVHYMNGEWPDQYVPCNAALVNKALWRATGGFPVETAVGAPDAAFISISMGNQFFPAKTLLVEANKPLYLYRTHSDTDTAQRTPYQGVILQVRDILTKTWRKPVWERYE